MSRLIVFIQCGKKKQSEGRHPASEMYTSNLFRTSLAYARKLTEDGNIRILSGKYGALRLTDIIEPYNVTLNNMTTQQRIEWGGEVMRQLRSQGINSDAHAVFLTGENYQRYLRGYFRQSEDPLHGMGLGYRIQYMKRRLDE